MRILRETEFSREPEHNSFIGPIQRVRIVGEVAGDCHSGVLDVLSPGVERSQGRGVLIPVVLIERLEAEGYGHPKQSTHKNGRGR